jgi:hypothetical protein
MCRADRNRQRWTKFPRRRAATARIIFECSARRRALKSSVIWKKGSGRAVTAHATHNHLPRRRALGRSGCF